MTKCCGSEEETWERGDGERDNEMVRAGGEASTCQGKVS